MRAKVVPLIIGTLIHLFEWSLPGNMDPANLDHEKEKNSITYNLLKGSNPHAFAPKMRKQILTACTMMMCVYWLVFDVLVVKKCCFMNNVIFPISCFRSRCDLSNN